jgi:CHASE1-domain containing sensor protein
MDEFLKMDIFFVVATIGFVVLAVLVCVVLIYVIQLLRTINRVAETVEDETEALKGDLDDARASIRSGGNSLLALVGLAGNTGKRLLKKKRRKS